jgi:hypothetical protein
MLLNFMSQHTVNKAIHFAPAAPDGRTSHRLWRRYGVSVARNAPWQITLSKAKRTGSEQEDTRR